MNHQKEIHAIKEAIIKGQAQYKGFDLPKCQTGGKPLQIQGHATQQAIRFYTLNFKK